MHDLLIKNARIIDGSGDPEYTADLAISDGRISSIGPKIAEKATRQIETSGWVVAPGFIDIHTHSDLPVLELPTADSKVMGGVTTEVLGNCGMSAAPLSERESSEIAQGLQDHGIQPWQTLGEYLDRLESRRASLNIAAIVGHGTVRLAAMGWDSRRPSSAELDEMKDLVDEAMKSGAFGLSTGLAYTPGSNATRDEIVELARVVARYNGFYT
ncbi:MAG: amidohydrolase family protein, partial [Candidatus Latescibacteria bacterium]|nr:amidohydrolase family protein [Candidatus Latescibacterota bacterium]